MTPLLYLAFFLSGAAGLMYEAIWSRYLGLFVGHSAYAQIIVLVIFLGGMSLGAILVGRRAERFRAPLLWYAGVELVVGLIAIVFHDTYGAFTTWAYDTLIPAVPAGAAVIAVKWIVAGLLVLPQSILLGTTFPFMSAGVVRRGGLAGHTISLLYFSNSLGAAVGVLVAGFWMLAAAGLPGTLLFAGIVNIVVALVVGVVARRSSPVPVERAPVPPMRQHAPLGGEMMTADRDRETMMDSGGAPRAGTSQSATARTATSPASTTPASTTVVSTTVASATPVAPAGDPALARMLLIVAFGTAAASFIYEIAWIRMLSLVLGSATHAFELMLSAFILGLALGALQVRRHADHFRRPLLALGVVQWVMGALAVATLPVYLWTFRATAGLVEALDATDAGYTAFTIARYGLSLLVMLPATFCAGMTLPLITRTLMVSGSGERAIGTVYGVNTLGSIIGAALAGLVLMPALGLKTMLVAGALVDMALGIWLVARSGAVAADTPAASESPARARVRRALGAEGARARPLAAAAIAATVVLVAGTAWSASFDPHVLTSGVFRFGIIRDDSRDTILFYRDGRTATVSVRQSRVSGDVTIATNGKPDASLALDWLRPVPAGRRRSLGGDQPTQMLLPLVTLAHGSGARTAAVIGQGSGISSHFLLGSPRLESLVTIDIEPEMIRGSRFFHPANRRVFDDPRSVFAIDDAKSYFAAHRARYDLILSEPSNPWVSGVSGLFTTEFYARVRNHLTDDGVFGQWLHLYEIDDGLVLSVIAAVHENFPSYEMYLVASSDLLIVASNRPELPPARWEEVTRFPGVQEDLRHLAPITASDFDALRVAGSRVFAPLLGSRHGGAVANSDFYPTLDLGAERARYLQREADGLTGLAVSRFDLAAALEGRKRDFGVMFEASVPGIPRLEALATGARLRLSTADADSLVSHEMHEARFTHDVFMRSLATSAPPSSWSLWTRAAAEAEARVHGGTAGVADERFYGAVRGFLDRTAAPPTARAGIDFLHALALHDWDTARAASPPLLSAAARGEEWIPAELLRNGLVVAELAVADTRAARETFRRLTPRIDRDGAEVRTKLLDAWITRAEASR